MNYAMTAVYLPVTWINQLICRSWDIYFNNNSMSDRFVLIWQWLLLQSF